MKDDPDYQFTNKDLTIYINNEDNLLEDIWGIKLISKESVFLMKDYLLPT